MHRYNSKDVNAAFARYVEVTGDSQASLHGYGDASWGVQNGRIRGAVWNSHREAYKALHGYADGWQDAIRELQRKESVHV